MGNTTHKKMKTILFINMPIRELSPPNNCPLGPICLATFLRKRGYDVEILDLNIIRPFLDSEMLDNLLNTIVNRYDVFCLSGLLTTFKFQEYIADGIKKINPHAKIIAGGGLATDIGEKLLNWIPSLDSINIGPGELTIETLINSKSKIERGILPINLDDYPFDYSLISVEKYIQNPIWGSLAKNSSSTPFSMKRSLNSITSRGCPFHCNFCSKMASSGNQIRYRSAESLIGEMKQLIKDFSIDFIGYVDDNACANKRRLIRWNNLMKHENFNLRWGTHARLDDIGFDKEKAKILSDLGCIYLGFGGESASKRILKVMNKGLKVINSEDYTYEGYTFPKIYVDALENCKKNGIHPNLTWISNYPGETLKDLQTTVAFILFMEDEDYVEKRYNNRSMFVATAYQNTQLFNEPYVQSKLKLAFDSLRDYTYSLGDATQTIRNNGTILNYSVMSDEDFLLVREYINSNEIEKILDMEA